MSSIKPEVHNVLQCRQRRTEPRPQGMCRKNFMKISPAAPEICSWTDRQISWPQYPAPLPGQSKNTISQYAQTMDTDHSALHRRCKWYFSTKTETKAFCDAFNQQTYRLDTLQYIHNYKSTLLKLNMLLNVLLNNILLTRILASMTAASKQTDSTKNVFRPFCVACSMIQSRRDRTELVASYTCQSHTHTQSFTPQHREMWTFCTLAANDTNRQTYFNTTIKVQSQIVLTHSK